MNFKYSKFGSYWYNGKNLLRNFKAGLTMRNIFVIKQKCAQLGTIIGLKTTVTKNHYFWGIFRNTLSNSKLVNGVKCTRAVKPYPNVVHFTPAFWLMNYLMCVFNQ